MQRTTFTVFSKYSLHFMLSGVSIYITGFSHFFILLRVHKTRKKRQQNQSKTNEEYNQLKGISIALITDTK